MRIPYAEAGCSAKGVSAKRSWGAWFRHSSKKQDHPTTLAQYRAYCNSKQWAVDTLQAISTARGFCLDSTLFKDIYLHTGWLGSPWKISKENRDVLRSAKKQLFPKARKDLKAFHDVVDMLPSIDIPGVLCQRAWISPSLKQSQARCCGSSKWFASFKPFTSTQSSPPDRNLWCTVCQTWRPFAIHEYDDQRRTVPLHAKRLEPSILQAYQSHQHHVRCCFANSSYRKNFLN